jgi:type IV secretion system protein VirB10
MADTVINPGVPMQGEPELRRTEDEPKGVIRKGVKPMIYLGVAALVIVAAIFSSSGNKGPKQKGSTNQTTPQPALQDNTDNNVQDLKSLAAERRRETEDAQQSSALANATAAQQAAAAMYGQTGQPVPCPPGQACPQQTGAYGQQPQQQLSPAEQEEQQLAAKERELAYNARFASNLVYTRQPDASAQQQPREAPDMVSAATYEKSATYASASQPGSSLIVPRSAGDPPAASASQEAGKHNQEVNIDSASGQPYVIYEGLTMDTVLMNRLDGDAAGPVKVLVSNPVYSHDHQHVLVPDGTIVLGEARKIGASGFGQQRRLALVFHRMIMPDGYSVDLDQFHGLNQIGEEGAKDKVNNHYLEIFGTSIALGVIAGAGVITQGGGTISTNGSQAFTTGAAGSVSQSATTILDRFIQIPPTITIREGQRIKVYFTQDMLLPAYENHTVPQTF